jgi:hypothetical protein
MSVTPFDKAYVLRETALHICHRIDISVRKVVNRLPELVQDPEKSREALMTLMELNSLRKQIAAGYIDNDNHQGTENELT